MAFRKQFTVTVTRVRQARDRHGDKLGTTQQLAFLAAVVPSSSAEDLANGEQVATRQFVYPIDPTVDVVAADRLRLPGETGTPWQVVGDPKRFLSPYSGTRATEMTIERVTG